MEIKHHPSEEFLLDYTTGALDEGFSLAIATHLSFCHECRNTVSALEAIGGNIIESIKPADLLDPPEINLENIFKIEQEHSSFKENNSRNDLEKPLIPQPLRRYIGSDVSEVNWKRLGLGVHQSIIPINQNQTSARLLNIPAGHTVPEHGHDGIEMTLVISGAFSDSTGYYGKGDLQIASEELEHQPYEALGENCICLVITESPLRFKKWPARIAQPFIGI